MMLSFSQSITYVHQKTKIKRKITRQINNYTLITFQTLLEQEMWEFVYQKQDTNCMYNSFPSNLHVCTVQQ
jgi:succinylglutamate desuccinylase